MKILLSAFIVMLLSTQLFSQKYLKIGGNHIFGSPEILGEINFITKPNNNIFIKITMTQVSLLCWNQYHNIDTSFKSGTLTGYEDLEFCICWEPYSGHPTFGLGKYLFTVYELSNNTYVEKTHFYIDYRTSTLPDRFYSSDLNIYYSVWDHNLYYSDTTTHFPSNGTDETTIWEEFEIVQNDPTGLEPATPEHLDQTASWGSPHLVWDSQPSDYFRTGYVIHRSINSSNYSKIDTTSATTYSYDDNGLVLNGGSYAHYYITAINGNSESGQSNVVDVSIVQMDKRNASNKTIPNSINLTNYPNPFNPETIIFFNLFHKSNVEITIYNAFGQVVKKLFNGIKDEGKHEIIFDGNKLASGIYYYCVKTDYFNETRKMILLK